MATPLILFSDYYLQHTYNFLTAKCSVIVKNAGLVHFLFHISFSFFSHFYLFYIISEL